MFAMPGSLTSLGPMRTPPYVTLNHGLTFSRRSDTRTTARTSTRCASGLPGGRSPRITFRTIGVTGGSAPVSHCRTPGGRRSVPVVGRDTSSPRLLPDRRQLEDAEESNGRARNLHRTLRPVRRGTGTWTPTVDSARTDPHRGLHVQSIEPQATALRIRSQAEAVRALRTRRDLAKQANRPDP